MLALATALHVEVSTVGRVTVRIVSKRADIDVRGSSNVEMVKRVVSLLTACYPRWVDLGSPVHDEEVEQSRADCSWHRYQTLLILPAHSCRFQISSRPPSPLAPAPATAQVPEPELEPVPVLVPVAFSSAPSEMSASEEQLVRLDAEERWRKLAAGYRPARP